MKSDGFAAIAGDTVLTVDGGLEEDRGILDYLLNLRRTWLQDHPDLIENDQARLEINMMLTHGHKDHLTAVWKTVNHPLIQV